MSDLYTFTADATRFTSGSFKPVPVSFGWKIAGCITPTRCAPADDRPFRAMPVRCGSWIVARLRDGRTGQAARSSCHSFAASSP